MPERSNATPREHRGRPGRAAALLFAPAVFVAAALLFAVQPLTAKGLLPVLGGSPSVWTTCMLFFQTVLLAGYAWAHGLARLLPAAGLALHAAALAIAGAISLRVGFRTPTPPEADASPVLWLLAELAVSAGPAFFALSATGPLLQRWYADLPADAAGARPNPYPLYAASNLGSFVGLLGYPLAAEPMLSLAQQRGAWLVAAGVAGGLILMSGVLSVSGRRGGVRQGSTAPPVVRDADTRAPRPLRRRAMWALLAFVPSSLTLGVTQHLSTDVAAFPLLWVLPLGIYLLSMVAAFGLAAGRASGPGPGVRPLSRVAAVLLLGVCAVLLLHATEPAWAVLLLHVALLAVGAYVAHARLAMLRPAGAADRDLTEFYLWIGVGGALGGVFNGVLAPLIFDDIVEYRVALVLLAAVLWLGDAPAGPPESPTHAVASPPARRGVRRLAGLWLMPAAVLLALGAAEVARGVPGVDGGYAFSALAVGLPLLLVFLASRRADGFARAVAVLFTFRLVADGVSSDRFARRTFFGVHRVFASPATDEAPAYRGLMHGTTTHGAQLTDRPELPTVYYHPEGPIGDVFKGLRQRAQAEARPLRVALIGMGVGALAAYGEPGDAFTFYEIDPAVVGIASDAALFTFLADSKASVEVIVGDGRLRIADAADGAFDLVVVDAFSSDAIPMHLLTAEALRLFIDKTRGDGAVALHISNRHLRLEPVAAATAHAAGLAVLVRDDTRPPEASVRQDLRAGSAWLLAARTRDAAQAVLGKRVWLPVEADPSVRPWTDGYASVLPWIDWGVSEE